SESLEAATRWLRVRGATKVAALGASEGAAAAILADGNHHFLDAIIADSAYANLGAMLWRSPSIASLNPALQMTARWEVHLLLGSSPESISPANAAATIGCPLLIVQNSGDPLTPPRDGQLIFEKAPKGLATVAMMKSAGHADAIFKAPDVYTARVLPFLEAILQSRPIQPIAH